MSTLNVRARLDAADFRPRFNLPKDVVTGRFAFAGTLTDNTTVGDTSPADLTASGGLKSQAAEERLGVTLPAADPTLVVVIERMGIQFHPGVETDLIIAELAREVYLKHTPANDIAAVIDLCGYLTSAVKGGKNGVIATGGFGAEVCRPELYDLETPIVCDLQRDALIVSLHTLVNSAANVPFTLWCDGAIFHNRDYQRSSWVDELPGQGENADIKALFNIRAQKNALREIKYGRAIVGRK